MLISDPRSAHEEKLRAAARDLLGKAHETRVFGSSEGRIVPLTVSEVEQISQSLDADIEASTSDSPASPTLGA